MKPKHVYLILCAIGTAVPLIPFVPWLGDHGLDLPLLARELFANRVSSFFALDLVVTAAATIYFAAAHAQRVRLWWLPILATISVGVSLGLPLFLYLRESEADNKLILDS